MGEGREHDRQGEQHGRTQQKEQEAQQTLAARTVPPARSGCRGQGGGKADGVERTIGRHGIGVSATSCGLNR